MSKNNLLQAVLICLVLANVIRCSKPIELPASDSDNGGLFLPGNFEALVVVDSIGRTRHIAVNANGDIYVQLNYSQDGKGTIALRDVDHDGKADSIVHFGDYVDKGRGATGVAIHNGYLYTSTRKMIYRNKLREGELIPSSETEIVLTDLDENVDKNWHTTKPVAFDNKGNMYVPFGAPSDACQDMKMYGPVGIPGGKGLNPCPELETHAGIWRFDANKIGLTQADGFKFATGIRSVVGMEWNPMDESLYAVGNGIDNFHTIFPDRYSSWQAAVLPSETLMKVTEGTNYGWPYAYYDQIQKKNVLQPGYGGDGNIIGRASEFDEPVIGFPGHWAPMDVMFYHGNQFPKRYNNGVFVAFHGSTDRPPYPQAGYIVCFVPFDNEGKAIGEWEVFADGFTGVDKVVNTSDAVYRPMGLSEGSDGSLYISESEKGKIWRVMYKGNKNKFGETELALMEKRKSRDYIRTPIEGVDNRQEGDMLSGRILYESYCAACHQRDGKGDNNRFPPLVDSDWVTGDETRLIDIVLNGRQGEIKVNGKTYDGLMPQNQHLEDLAIASILTYVRKRFGHESAPISALRVGKIRSTPIKK
ncbi:MAG: PQQ-dependent sugar dehydrogenase [Bacteroidia bacterium]|nr:PQQ-dependent sugar dehydrogenase [Bacteroidia bacterium]